LDPRLREDDTGDEEKQALLLCLEFM